jgi:succinyl-CoA synthetase beta subunit
MKIHEYQAKDLLRRYGITTPRGMLAKNPTEVRAAAEACAPSKVVLKAQVHAGGRGKGGGIQLAAGSDEAERLAASMLGMKLVTPQTGKEGKVVRKLLVEEELSIARELYLGALVDRTRRAVVLMASAAGGMDIEEVARVSPEKILKEWIDPSFGPLGFQLRRLLAGLDLRDEQAKAGHSLMQRLIKAFVACDASLVEINPLIVTEDGRLLALDVKLNLDDNALYRHPDLAALRDLDEEEPLEVEASRYNLSYIKLGGTIGCMVNGAGLAMATMDIIQLAGGMPANFLDVGGAADVERVAHAFQILLSDPNLRAVLINIFGGIVRCDRVAQGVIAALEKVQVKVPVVVRLAGTNAEEANRLLRESPLQFVIAGDLQDAAAQAVAAAGRAA